MLKLGITGGIGSGKSFVSRMLIQEGIPVFDCDSQAKYLTATSSQIRTALVDLLGEEVYTTEGLNKPLLASYLFASKENAERINSIIHPCVRSAFREWCQANLLEGVEVVAMESAILYESGFESEVDKVLMVYAPLSVRCERIALRDHISQSEVRARIAAQMPDEEKCEKADFIINNDGKSQLEEQLERLFLLLKGRKDDK